VRSCTVRRAHGVPGARGALSQERRSAWPRAPWSTPARMGPSDDRAHGRFIGGRCGRRILRTLRLAGMADCQPPPAWSGCLPYVRPPRLPALLGPIGRLVPRLRRIRRDDIAVAAGPDHCHRPDGRRRAHPVASPAARKRTPGCRRGRWPAGRDGDRVRIGPRRPGRAKRSGRRHRRQTGRRDRTPDPARRHRGEDRANRPQWRNADSRWAWFIERNEGAAVRWIHARGGGPDADELARPPVFPGADTDSDAGPETDAPTEAHAGPHRNTLPGGGSSADRRAAQQCGCDLDPGRLQRSGDRPRGARELRDRDPVTDGRARVPMRRQRHHRALAPSRCPRPG
jgi:hypothetical protein